MVCKKCNAEIGEGLKFCVKCGTKIDDTAPGKKILKISGIIFIGFAVLGIISIFSSIVLIPYLQNSGVSNFGGTTGMVFMIISGVIGVILNTVIGLAGIKYSNIVEKAKLLILMVVIFCIFQIVSIIISSSITKNAFSPISLINFILPSIFFIGAYMNYKAQEGK